MIRALVEGMLGEFGRQVLYFYEAHALVLNLIVIAYGLIMLLSWQNLAYIYRYMVVRVARQVPLHPGLNHKSPVKKIATAIPLPWQDALSASRFPLVASQVALVPVPKSAQALQKIFNQDELYQHALDVLNGADARKIQPSYKLMWSKEVAKKNGKV